MSNTNAGMSGKADYEIVKAPAAPASASATGPKSNAVWAGVFEVDHYSADGEFLGHYTAHNGITTQGVAHMLNLTLNPNGTETQAAAWYMGLLSGSPTLADTDVGGTHAGWTSVAVTARQEWLVNDTSTRSLATNGTTDLVLGSLGSPTLIGGIFLIDNVSTDTGSDTIFSTATFGTEPTVNSGDTLKVTYTVSVAVT